MGLLERISRGITRLIEWGMKLAGLASAINELLLHPGHATSVQLLLSGVLLMGGQATKDLVFGIVDRVVAPREQPPPPPAPLPPSHDEARG